MSFLISVVFQSLSCRCSWPSHSLELFLDPWQVSPAATEGLLLCYGANESAACADNIECFQPWMVTCLWSSPQCLHTFQTPCQNMKPRLSTFISFSSVKVLFCINVSQNTHLSESSFLQRLYIFKQYIICNDIHIIFPLVLVFLFVAMDDGNLLPAKEEITRQTSCSDFFLFFTSFFETVLFFKHWL